jgi:hypothetical protein
VLATTERPQDVAAPANGEAAPRLELAAAR